MDSFLSRVPRRISKLESFIRHQEDKIGSRNLRYYESCVVESKGTLIIGHLILTDETLFLTQNPPKSFSHEIPLARVQSIRLVADRRSLVTGPANNNNYLCQHVKLLYRGLKVKPKDGTPSKGGENGKWSEFEDGRSSTAGSSDSGLSSDSLKSCCCFDDLPEVPLRIQTDYHPHSCRTSLTPPSSKTPSEHSSDGHNSVENQIASEESHARSSSVLEQKLFSWRSRRENLSEKEVKRPNSVDISQLPKLRSSKLRTIVSHAFSRNNDKIDSPKLIIIKEEEEVLEEVGIYLYQPTSLFLNEAYLYWNRQILKSIIRGELENYREQERSLHSAEKEFARLGYSIDGDPGVLWYPKSKPIIWQRNNVFTRLNFLHASLHRYHHLARLCWKNPGVVTGLLGILKTCSVTGVKKEEKENSVESSDVERILFLQLSTYLLVMEIFRFLFESCSSSSSIRQPQQQQHESSQLNAVLIETSDGRFLEWNQITKILLHHIFSYPNSLLKRRIVSNKILRVNLRPQVFAKLDWANSSRNAKIVALVAMGHNTSAALLYEILAVVHFSRRDSERTSMFKHIGNSSVELFLRMSVTQVMHLLWPAYEQLTASQCVLLHIQVSILTTLLNSIASIKKFLQLAFSEEFQYCMSGQSARKKIPDNCPIKEKLLKACDELRNAIIS